MTIQELSSRIPINSAFELDPSKKYLFVVDPAAINQRDIEMLVGHLELDALVVFSTGGCGLDVMTREEARAWLESQS